MPHSESYCETAENRFIKFENVSNKIFDTLIEVNAREDRSQRKSSRPVSFLLEIVGIEEADSLPAQPQRRVLSRIVPQNEIDGELVAPHQNPANSAGHEAGQCHEDANSNSQIPPCDNKPVQAEAQSCSEAETMAAIRRVMVAQRRETNLRNLPDLLSPEEFELGGPIHCDEDNASMAAVAEPAVKSETVFSKWKRIPVLKHLCSWKAAALATAVLVFPNSLASTASLLIVTVLTLTVLFGPEPLFRLFRGARAQV